MELMNCPSLAVPNEVMHHVVRVESSYNPYAIGVVGGRLVRQPRNLAEALATVRMLESKGYNFSLGLAQVNRYNLGKYGLGSYEKAFQACPNLQAGSRILAECYGRSGGDWGKSFSCYYSGNFTTGFRQGYVGKVYASIREASASPEGRAIRVVSGPSRREVPATRHLPRATDRVAQRTVESSFAFPQSQAMPSAQPLPAVGATVAATDPPTAVQPAQSSVRTATPESASPGDQAFVF